MIEEGVNLSIPPSTYMLYTTNKRFMISTDHLKPLLHDGQLIHIT